MKSAVKLSEILKEDKTAIDILKNSINKDGYCFVRINMYKNLIKRTKSLTDSVFNSPHRTYLTDKYETGYKETKFKHHYRMLTGDLNLPNISGKWIDFSKHTTELSSEMNKLMLRTSDILLKHIFKMKQSHKNNLTIYGDKSTGLLDIVRYKPNLPNDYYVVEHVDPGLFSLNLLSNACGMEFYSRSQDKWVNLPVGYGAIFCGKAAKDYCNLPDVRHRVFNNKVGRFTIWFEVGINEQIKQYKPSKVSCKGTTKDITLKVYGRNEIIKMGENATVGDLKNEIDKTIGVPMSKTRYIPPLHSKENYNEPIGNRLTWRLEESLLSPV